MGRVQPELERIRRIMAVRSLYAFFSEMLLFCKNQIPVVANRHARLPNGFAFLCHCAAILLKVTFALTTKPTQRCVIHVQRA